MNVRFVVVTALVFAVMLAAAMSVPLASGVPFLSNDGPTQAYGAFVHNHYDDAALAFPRFVTLHTPLTAQRPEIFRALEPLFGWRIAMHLTHVVVAEAWALAFFTFVLALEPRRAAIGLLGFPCALQSTLFHGFLPFALGTAIGFVTVAVWLRSNRASALVVVAVLLFAVAMCHPVALCITGLALGAVVVGRELSGPARSRAWVRRLLALFAASTPALVLVWCSLGAVSEVGTAMPPAWDDVVDRTLFVARGFQPAGDWRPLFALALMLLGVVRVVQAARAHKLVLAHGALAATSTLLLVASMALPRDLGNWQVANTRLLPFAMMGLIAMIDVEAFGARAYRAILVVIGVYSLTSFAWAAKTEHEIADATAPALAGLSQMKPEPRDWLPVITKVDGDHAPFDIERYAPLMHLADLYAIELGGVTTFSQADLPSIHQVLRAHPDHGETPTEQDFALRVGFATPAARPAELRKALALASTHDGIVYYGEPGDPQILVDDGFVPSFMKDGLFIGHFEGCRGVVHLEGLHAPVHVDLGWWPRRTRSITIEVAPADGESVVDVPFGHIGCGEVWLNVPGHACANTIGPVRGTFAKDGANVLRCTLE